MQNVLLLLSILSIPYLSIGQPCSNPQSQTDLFGNNIKARILNGGDLFTDFQKGKFIPNPGGPGTDSPSTIFAAGILLGGLDPAGNLRFAGSIYRDADRHDFSAGPLYADGTTNGFNCSNWDRFFVVKAERIEAFRADLPMTASEAIAAYPEIMGWPGKDNPHFADVNGFVMLNSPGPMAPFFDADLDGVYNPLVGDYPVVKLRDTEPFIPSEIIWCVFNDNGGANSYSMGVPLQTEIHLTAWAFDCPSDPVLDNTVFTSHKFIYRGTETLSDVYVGLWADVDLGCPLDDNFGCNPDLATMYAYNETATDKQNCFPVTPFPNTPPVQTITFLNQPLSKYSVQQSGPGDFPPSGMPVLAIEGYRYLSGIWRDGIPLTQGGNGYGGTTPANHLFPDDPADVNGWSMCTTNLPVGNRTCIGSTYFDTWQPGQITEMNVAWAVHPNTPLPCGLGSTFDDVSALRSHYEDGFEGICTSVKAPELPASSVMVFPNPTANATIIQYGNLLPRTMRLFDTNGRLVWAQNSGFGKAETVLETNMLGAGIYALQVHTDQGVVVKKLVVMR